MGDTAGVLLENFYNRQYTSKLNIESSYQSLETLTNESNNQLKIVINERNVNFKDIKSEHENNNNLYEDENKLSDKSTTLFRTSHEYDTFLPSIESVFTDNDLTDLAHEFEEYGKSFSRDSISIEKEERDFLFPLTEPPKKDFSEKFKVKIDPKTKYTYNNLYNINTEIYSPSNSQSKSNNKSNSEGKKFIDDGERLDIRYIQNALLFDNKKDERELSNSNENILKNLNDTSNKRATKSSFMDIDFDLNTKHLSAITKVEKDNLSIKEDDDITLYSKNRMSYQSTRPTYLTNHQPAQPLQLNIYNKQAKRISSSPKPSPLSESNIDHYNRMENNYGKQKINESNNFKGYISSPSEKEITSPIKSIPSKECSIDDSTSSDDIPLANITQRKINPLLTPTLSSLSISVPDDKKSSTNMTSVSNDKSRRLKTKPLIDLTNENIDYLKPEFSNSIANDSPERKVSTKMPKKKKKKKNYFSHCCSGKVLENNYTEEGNRSINKDRYIKYQKDQIHSFEAKRLNGSKVKIDNLSSPNLNPTYMKRKSVITEYKKEISVENFNSNYLNRKSNENSEITNKNIINRNQSLSSVSSVSDIKSSKSSNSKSSSSNSNDNNCNSKNQGIGSEKKYIKKNDYLDININNKSLPKSVIIPTNQPNSQNIQSKKSENITPNIKSPSSANCDISSTQNENSTIPPTLNNRKKQEIKYCTSYEIDENGNWKLVERRYNDSKILKVETISRKMI